MRHGIHGRGAYSETTPPASMLLEDQVPPPYGADALLGGSPHHASLIRGGDDPLLPHLLSHFARAERADLAIANLFEGGTRKTEAYLREFLHASGHTRTLTDDHMDVTEPEALLHLVDLQEMVKIPPPSTSSSAITTMSRWLSIAVRSIPSRRTCWDRAEPRS